MSFIDEGESSMRGAFQPTVHGFNFRNSFSGYPLPFEIPYLAQASASYGLCGGMSAAACDFYAAGRAIPATDTVPTKDTPLYDYLYQRQLATLGESGAYILKFLAWMALPDDNVHGTRSLTYHEEFPAVRRELDQGRPVVIGLVYITTKKRTQVWETPTSGSSSMGAPPDLRISFAWGVSNRNLPQRDD